MRYNEAEAFKMIKSYSSKERERQRIGSKRRLDVVKSCGLVVFFGSYSERCPSFIEKT